MPLRCPRHKHLAAPWVNPDYELRQTQPEGLKAVLKPTFTTGPMPRLLVCREVRRCLPGTISNRHLPALLTQRARLRDLAGALEELSGKHQVSNVPTIWPIFDPPQCMTRQVLT